MAYLLFVSLLWAFSFGLIKGVLTGVDAFFISFARLSFSLILFFPFLRWRKIDRRSALRLFWIGMLQYGLMYLAYIYSFQYLKAYEVALFTIFTPLYIALVYAMITRRISPRFLLSALLAIAGTAIVVWQDLGRQNFWLGFWIVQLSNLAFALGQVLYKRYMKQLPEVRDRDVFGLLYLGGVVLTLLAVLGFSDLSQLQLNGTQWLTLAYLGLVASGLGFFLWNVGARRVNIGVLAVFNNLKIPLATAVSLIFFGETTDWRTLLLGGSLVLLALRFSQQAGNSQVKPQILPLDSD